LHVPQHVVAWSLDFLNGGKQFVKIDDSVSNTVTVGAGTPQGTVSGHNDFKFVINDLQFNTSYVKHVDDTTVLFVSKNVDDNTLQDCAEHLVRWTQINGMKINTNKTKELIICFSKKVSIEDIPHLSIHGYNIDRVTTFKLLGIVISADLTWDSHVTYILQKVAERMYCIMYLI